MAKSKKKKSEIVFLVCKETRRLQLHRTAEAGRGEAAGEEVLPAACASTRYTPKRRSSFQGMRNAEFRTPTSDFRISSSLR